VSTEMTESVATALRAELVDHVSRTATRKRFWRRRRYPLFALIAAAIAGGGVALATQLGNHFPGSDQITNLSTPIVVKAEGSKAIELGQPPAGANRLDYQFRCLTAGTFTFPDGARETCNAGDKSVMTYRLFLAPGEHTVRVAVQPARARWQLRIGYVHAVETAWGINAKGQTYGVQNSRGMPDLIAVLATNGRVGYAYSLQIVGPLPTSPAQAVHWHPAPRSIPVYQPDGVTVIGQFRTG
jgi:hypothetical protein